MHKMTGLPLKSIVLQSEVACPDRESGVDMDALQRCDVGWTTPILLGPQVIIAAFRRPLGER